MDPINQADIDRMKSQGDIQGLINSLSYESGSPTGGDVRGAAAKALGELKNDTAIEPLILALKDEDRWVRRDAAQALGEFRDARAVEPLIAVLRDLKGESNEQIRLTVIETLGKLRDNRAVGSLITALKERNYWLRKAAADALGELKDARAVEPLTIALQDKIPVVREAVSEALRQIGQQPEELMEDIMRDKVPLLLDELAHTSPSMRSAQRLSEIIEALRLSGDSRAIPALTKLEEDIVELIMELRMEIAKETGVTSFDGILPSAFSFLEQLHNFARNARSEIEHKGQRATHQQTASQQVISQETSHKKWWQFWKG
jgi:HEAT repeat protein